MHSQISSTSTLGFALIELLVSLSIIAVLASLLLPALTGAKYRAQLACCSNNLRQLQLAMHLYTIDNNEVFPANWYAARGLDDTYQNWVGGLMVYETEVGPKARSILGDSTNEAILIERRFGHIGGYSQNSKIYKCPADQSYVVLEDGRHRRVRSYSLNGYVGNWPAPTAASLFFRTFGDFGKADPSTILSFSDEHEDSLMDGFFMISDPHSSGGPGYGLFDAAPALHHGRSTPFAFCDGHVENKVWQDKRTLVPVSRTAWPGVKFDTPNQDCDWLFEHSTKRINSP